MADADAARSRALYDPLLSTSASRSVSSFPGETFGVTSTNASVGVTQYHPTGGSIAVATQTGYTNADSDLTGVPSKSWQSSAGISISQPLLKNAGKDAELRFYPPGAHGAAYNRASYFLITKQNTNEMCEWLKPGCREANLNAAPAPAQGAPAR